MMLARRIVAVAAWLIASTLAAQVQTDLVFFAPLVEDAAKKIAAAGATVSTEQLSGPYGHLNGVLSIAGANDKIRQFFQ